MQNSPIVTILGKSNRYADENKIMNCWWNFSFIIFRNGAKHIFILYNTMQLLYVNFPDIKWQYLNEFFQHQHFLIFQTKNAWIIWIYNSPKDHIVLFLDYYAIISSYW